MLQIVEHERKQTSRMAINVMRFACIESVVFGVLFTTVFNQFWMVELGTYEFLRDGSTISGIGFLSLPAGFALFMGVEFAFVACRMAFRSHNERLFRKLGIITFIFIPLAIVLVPVGVFSLSTALADVSGSLQPVSLFGLFLLSRVF